MTAARRDFLERYSAAWSERAAARRRSGTATDLRIADTLDRVVATMRAELASLPDEVSSGTEPASAVTWRSPVFNVGGRFNPFAGSHAQAMLASADVCDRIGEPAAAAAYRRSATAAETVAPALIVPHLAPPRSRDVWSGPNITPQDPTPFVAGPQLGLFA